MTIKIYRYGNYINAVHSKTELHKWLIDNLPYSKGDGFVPENTSFKSCLELAEKEHYVFKQGEDMNDRIDKIIESARLEDVAKEFVSLKKKGENYIYDCPMCGARMAALISPKYQIYKCYTCGETGNVINFVMKMKRCTYKEALEWLEKTYNTK